MMLQFGNCGYRIINMGTKQLAVYFHLCPSKIHFIWKIQYMMCVQSLNCGNYCASIMELKKIMVKSLGD